MTRILDSKVQDEATRTVDREAEAAKAEHLAKKQPRGAPVHNIPAGSVGARNLPRPTR